MGFPDTIENHGCCNEFNKVILEGAKQNKAKNDLRRHHHGSGNETWAKGIGVAKMMHIKRYEMDMIYGHAIEWSAFSEYSDWKGWCLLFFVTSFNTSKWTRPGASPLYF